MGYDALVVIGSCDAPMRGWVRALRASDGSLLWEQQTGHPFAGPVLAHVGDSVIAASDDRTLIAWQAADGTVLWETTLPDRHDWPRSRGRTHLVASGALAIALYRKYVFALDVSTGALRWEYAYPDLPDSGVDTAGLLGMGQEQAYITEWLFVRTPVPPGADATWLRAHLRRANPRVTRALALHDGTVRWTTEASSAWLTEDEPSSLLERAGVVYTFGSDGLHALDSTTGAPVWTQQLAVPDAYGGILASWHGGLVAVSGFELGVYEYATGASVWRVTGRPPTTSPGSFSGGLVLGDAIYTLRGPGSQQAAYIEGREATTGTVTMTWPDDPTTLQDHVAWRFRGVDDMLFVPRYDSLHAIRAVDGQELWQTDLSCPSDAVLAVPATTGAA